MPEEDFENTDIPHTPLIDGDVVIAGAAVLRTIKSPGHTFGMSTLLLNERFIFTGDAIFIHSLGRPDLSGQADVLAPMAFASMNKLKDVINDDVTILPSHFSSDEEKNEEGIVAAKLNKLENKLFATTDETEFVKEITANLPPQPPNYQVIREINNINNKPTLEEVEELEFGKNNCECFLKLFHKLNYFLSLI